MSNSRYLILNGLQLSDAEQSVLKAVESLKMAGNAARISRLADRPRTSTIHTLEKLTKWKLVKEIHIEKRRHWFKRTLR